MALQTGENEHAMRKIVDMTRLMAIAILAIHFYYYLYQAFVLWDLAPPFTEKLLGNIRNTGLFNSFLYSKLISLGLLLISLLGIKGRKDEKASHKTALAYIITGLLLYFFSFLILLPRMAISPQAIIYITITSTGFLLVLSGGTILTRIIKDRLSDDIFNTDNETFPQEERLLINEYSINLEATYNLRGKVRKSYVSIVSPQRACLLAGSPGAGKTAFLVREFLAQSMAKTPTPYTMFVYDFKWPDLSTIAYNHWLKNKERYKAKSDCFFINFDDLSRSHRCNVFHVMGMADITDAAESAATILVGLNRTWETKRGEFFTESPINFVTAVIWFLRKYEGGKYCTLPHVIELIQVQYEELFSVLSLEPEISVLINPFLSAFKAKAKEQLEGQIASAKIALARLSSPQLYYVLSGDDFQLDINNPKHPKLVCMGNNPQKTQTLGAVISLYVNRMLKIVNQKDKEKLMLMFEEFPTLAADVIPTITTGRSNKISTCLVIQDFSQLRKDYGKDKAEVIVNTVGNIISGQVIGDSAKQISDRIGKIMQDRTSLSINSGDTSISKSKQLDLAVPPSTIAGLSSGEFVGMVADTPQQKIKHKAFHCNIKADFDAINKEEKAYKAIPVIRQVNNQMIQRNYMQIKDDVQHIIFAGIEKIITTPHLNHLLIIKT
ncbi:MAG: YWFCY domain-containing protein [Sphingobacterium sp.]|jgi:hypothetical protein|nr:YWFCY domain-containing protein [Sphingobacterium sp.]